MDIVSKINGNTLSATEFNQIPTELEAGISATGQTPSDAILNQVPIFVSRFAANNFYIDSGTADNYILTLASSFTNPVSNVAGEGYFTGMTIRFRAGNAGTGGAATVNVNGAGVKSLKEADGTTNPSSIPTTEDTMWRYDGTVFRKVNLVVAAIAFKANITTNATITNNAYTKILYNSAPVNFGGWFNTSTSRWTPLKAGYYLVNQTLRAYDVTGTISYLHSQIEKNASEIAYFNANNSNSGNDVSAGASIITYMNGTTDYIEFYTQGIRTTAANFTISSTISRTFCQATFLGN